MSSINALTFTLAFCLAISLVYSAPTETEGSTTPMAPEVSSTANNEAASSTQSSSMAVSSAQDQSLVQTSFSCYDRQVGYYADVDSACKVYHFCMLGDYNGQQVYQRISYLCLNDTVFDQQALDCVASTKMTAPCAQSAKYYDESNTILRKAIIGKPESEKSVTSKQESTAAPVESTTAAIETTSSTEAPTTASTPAATSTTTTTTPDSTTKSP